MEIDMLRKLCLVVMAGSIFGCATQSNNTPAVYKKPDRNTVFTAQHHQAEIDGAAYSVSGKFRTNIRFLNRSGETRKVFWLDYEGKRKLFKELLAGQEHGLDTYLTHPWLITDKNDMALEIYFPDTKKRVIELK
jgi:von Hippel-Lindau disease tumor supressor